MKRVILLLTAALTAAVAVRPCTAQTPPPEYITVEDSLLYKNSRKAIEAAIQDTIAAELAAARKLLFGQEHRLRNERNIQNDNT